MFTINIEDNIFSFFFLIFHLFSILDLELGVSVILHGVTHLVTCYIIT